MKLSMFQWLSILLFLPVVAAHSGTAGENDIINFDNPILYIELTGIWVLLLTTILIVLRKKTYMKKRSMQHLFFWSITITVAISSLYLGWYTVYRNFTSETGGPVHWHADFEVWNCGMQLELVNPTGIRNRVGTSLLHEHNDMRMHIEGTLSSLEEADIHYFFESIGGTLEEGILTFPSSHGFLQMKDGDFCKSRKGKVQVFVYRIVNARHSQKENFIYHQEKLNNFQYKISQYSNVPPGDCIIIEFDVEKEKTDKICDSYEIAQSEGRMKEEK